MSINSSTHGRKSVFDSQPVPGKHGNQETKQAGCHPEPTHGSEIVGGAFRRRLDEEAAHYVLNAGGDIAGDADQPKGSSRSFPRHHV